MDIDEIKIRLAEDPVALRHRVEQYEDIRFTPVWIKLEGETEERVVSRILGGKLCGGYEGAIGIDVNCVMIGSVIDVLWVIRGDKTTGETTINQTN